MGANPLTKKIFRNLKGPQPTLPKKIFRNFKGPRALFKKIFRNFQGKRIPYQKNFPGSPTAERLQAKKNFRNAGGGGALKSYVVSAFFMKNVYN